MIGTIKSLKEAKKVKYGRWAGNPKGNTYDEKQCAYEIFSMWGGHQCSRKNGNGINNLYCKQHAKKITA